MENNRLYFHTFILLLILVSLAFIWLLQPYLTAIFWGAILAIIFMPLHKRLLARIPKHPTIAALISLTMCILIVILPLIAVTGALVQEGATLYRRISSGELNLAAYLGQVVDALPPIVHQTLNDFGILDLHSLREKIAAGLMRGSQFLATQAFNVGQNTFGFLVGLGVMLYLLFFLFRDGPELARKSTQLIPLSEQHQHHLLRKFTTVVRATVKGNIVVAATQGLLGGLIFWILGIQGVLLWGVLMAFLSLLPAVGAALIWLPVAIYFLVSGSVIQGIILILYGVLVIGLVDNVLRPTLVGKDTKLPDYVVLISTLGGLAMFGLNGFVIGPLIAALFVSCWDLFPSAIQMSRNTSGSKNNNH